MNNYLVYSHVNRCTNKVFYIGIGDRGRAYDEKSRSKEWKKAIQDCYFDVEIIAKNLTKDLAFKIEQSMIDVYGLNNLVNKTKGGGGILGYSHTKESKLKISNGQIGRVKSVETIKKGINTRIERHSKNYKHIATGKIFKGLKNGCDYFGINYKLEHQRMYRNSYNKNFDLI